jgi:uncharacterized integral membrane protein
MRITIKYTALICGIITMKLLVLLIYANKKRKKVPPKKKPGINK